MITTAPNPITLNDVTDIENTPYLIVGLPPDMRDSSYILLEVNASQNCILTSNC